MSQRRRVQVIASVLLFGFFVFWHQQGPPRIFSRKTYASLDNAISDTLQNTPPKDAFKSSESLAVYTAITAMHNSLTLEPLPRDPRPNARATCPPAVPKPIPSSFSNNQICSLIHNKTVLMIGPEFLYRVHKAWLTALAPNATSCAGADYCYFHHLCRDTSLLRFIFSSTLEPITNPDDPVYSRQRIDPKTDIAIRDNHWWYRAIRSDLLVLNLAPQPAPASSYDGSERGQLTERAAVLASLNNFLPHLLHVLASLPKGKTVLWLRNNRLCQLDPWSLYHNMQVDTQTYLLKALLPAFGVPMVVLEDSFTSGAIVNRKRS